MTSQLASNDYILLMDLTPYQTTTNRAHIVIKVLCDENGLPQDVVAAGNNISGLQTLDLSAGIVNNVILDGGSVDLLREDILPVLFRPAKGEKQRRLITEA